MKNNKEIKLMWKIFHLINKKHCNNKLKIHKIFLYKKGGNEKLGFYRRLNGNKKSIGIYSEMNSLKKIMVFIHELSHAYVDQVLNLHFHHEVSKVIGNQLLQKGAKETIKEIIDHNKEFRKTEEIFMITLFKHLKMSLK